MLGAQAAVLVLTFARNILLARLLGPEQFGIATTYAVAMGFLEASFEFGPDKYILQAKEGGRAEVLGAAHTFTIARGLSAGLVLFLAADPIAALFHVPDLAWAYRTLALAPIIKGFIHFDFRRRQRDLSYRQEIGITLASTAAGFVVALAVALADRSHVAMLISVLAQVSVMVALSFAVAKIPYRLSTKRPELGALFRFGWPLVLNSLIIAGATGGDRALVGAAFGLETLAIYTATATLVGGPFLILQAVPARVMLPVLGPLRGQPLFKARYERFGAGIALSTLVAVIPLALIGPAVVPVLFGAGFRPDPLIVAALAAAGGFALLRLWTNLAALAVGDSKATLYTNLVRLSGLIIAGLGVAFGAGPFGVAIGMAIGELAALVFGLSVTQRVNNLPVTTGISFIVPTSCMIVITVVLAPTIDLWGWQRATLVAVCGVALSVATLLACSTDVRRICLNVFSAFRT